MTHDGGRRSVRTTLAWTVLCFLGISIIVSVGAFVYAYWPYSMIAVGILAILCLFIWAVDVIVTG